MAEQDPLAGGQEMTTQSVTFGKVGDFIKGTYTGKKLVNNPNKPGEQVYLYELKGWLGQYHNVDGKKNPVDPAVEVESGSYYIIWGGKQTIDDLFGRIKLGDIVGIHFKREDEAKTKGSRSVPALASTRQDRRIGRRRTASCRPAGHGTMAPKPSGGAPYASASDVDARGSL